MTPKIVNRRSGNGLYFKNSTLIEEMLTYLKVTQSLFSLMNVKIERDIRNNENRATNCVANNILKAVNASQKHIDAIQKLIDFGRFEALDEELQITAKLRLKYDDVSLMELAKLHEPPISKSGLNHRLKKLMDESSSLGDI
jgi:DNA-binding protein WhiA